MHSHESTSTDHNALEIFCVFLYIGCMSDLHRKFHTASTYDTSIKYPIWRHCYNLFLSYDNKRQTYAENKTSKIDIY